MFRRGEGFWFRWPPPRRSRSGRAFLPAKAGELAAASLAKIAGGRRAWKAVPAGCDAAGVRQDPIRPPPAQGVAPARPLLSPPPGRRRAHGGARRGHGWAGGMSPRKRRRIPAPRKRKERGKGRGVRGEGMGGWRLNPPAHPPANKRRRQAEGGARRATWLPVHSGKPLRRRARRTEPPRAKAAHAGGLVRLLKKPPNVGRQKCF